MIRERMDQTGCLKCRQFGCKTTISRSSVSQYNNCYNYGRNGHIPEEFSNNTTLQISHRWKAGSFDKKLKITDIPAGSKGSKIRKWESYSLVSITEKLSRTYCCKMFGNWIPGKPYILKGTSMFTMTVCTLEPPIRMQFGRFSFLIKLTKPYSLVCDTWAV